MSFRYGAAAQIPNTPRVWYVECDACGVQSIGQFSELEDQVLVLGRFIRMAPKSKMTTPRHACLECIRSNKVSIEGGFEPHEAGEMIDAIDAGTSADGSIAQSLQSLVADLPDAEFAEPSEVLDEALPEDEPVKNICLVGAFDLGTRAVVTTAVRRLGFNVVVKACLADVVVIANRLSNSKLGKNRCLDVIRDGGLRETIPVQTEREFFGPQGQGSDVYPGTPLIPGPSDIDEDRDLDPPPTAEQIKEFNRELELKPNFDI